MALLRHRDVSRLRQTIEGLLKTVQSDGRIHTTFNQTIAATGRLSVDRPQPAEHPDPHRGGSPDPRGLRGRQGLRLPADRRLQPDRDADHGPPVRGRPADRGVQVRPGLPLDHRVPRVRRAGRRGDPRAAGQDQGDELRPRLRPVRLRSGPAAAHRPRRGARADGRVLRDLRRRPRLPRRRRRRGPPHRLHRDHPRAAAATCPTSPATTASGARWPSGWRSTRRSRARPPT